MHFIGQQGLAPADGADIAFLSGSYEQNRMPGVAMPLAQEGRGYVNPSEKALDGWCKKGKGKRNTVRLLLEVSLCFLTPECDRSSSRCRTVSFRTWRAAASGGGRDVRHRPVGARSRPRTARKRGHSSLRGLLLPLRRGTCSAVLFGRNDAYSFSIDQSGKWANLLQTPSRRAWDFRQLRLISLHFRVDERGMGCCIPEIGIVERSPPA